MILAIPLLLSAALSPQITSQTPQLEAWELVTGSNWRLRQDPATGTARFLYGGSKAATFAPSSDPEWFELGRQALDAAFPLFSIADQTLVDEEVIHLPLAQIGGQNKMAVHFTQKQQGVRLVRGGCSVLFAEDGTLLAIDTTGLPGIENFSTAPLVDQYTAISIANTRFVSDNQRRAESIELPELVIIRHQPGKTAEPRLAWSIEMRAESGSVVPVGKRIFVAADNTLPEVLQVDELVHHQQVSGNVQAWASPGTLPDMSSNPEALFTMADMTVTSPAGNTTTDSNGDFSIATSGTSAVDVTMKFTGTWARVLDDSGAEYSITTSLTPGNPKNIAMNPSKGAADTSEANAFRGLGDFHDWVKAQNPSDTKMDFRATANVMLSSTCNAYYNGSSINFYAAGGGCNNTAYSTIVAHEHGHWANDKYGSGNGSDGFGEGNADVYSNYIYDTPITGEYFFTSGGYIRTGLNTRQYCGDGNGGCYGQVHADGEVLMGALWKVRDRLNNTLGNAAGDAVSDMLHSAWMNGYNDGQIHSIVEEHWLALDDTDGNIWNGTPNFQDIDNGFRDQGFPGVDLQLIDIVHTPLGDTQNEAGPYLVDAQISSWVGATITGAEVLYSVNDGPEQTLNMSQSGATWSANIPGQISPAKVEYHILAHDSVGNNVQDPRTGEYSFIVGVVTRLYFNDFEASTNEGWTHGQIATQDDWQRGTPTGASGTNSWGVAWQDPNTAYSGSKCWANDLGNSGWNGSYMPDVNNWLESASIDCTGAIGVKLRFQRWLSVEQGIYDNARIYVNGSLAWENPSGTHIQETGWSEQEIDISNWADNNSSVKIKFTLESDAGLELGGWAIDDLELLTIGSVPGGSNTIVLTGPTTAFAGTSLPYDINSAPANSMFWFAWSTNLNGSVVNGHSFDLGAPLSVALQGTTDAAGTASITTPVLPPTSSGMVIHLEVAAQDSSGALFDSNSISLTVL